MFTIEVAKQEPRLFVEQIKTHKLLLEFIIIDTSNKKLN
jgi:hypothetical protein